MEKPLAPIDKVTVQYGAHNVWIDHNEFFSDLDHGIDFYDGQVDVTHGADFITVSWNVFHDHFKNSLVGNSENTGDEDTGHLRITYHHNFFHQVDGRNPSIRFGTGHVYNNYYLDLGDYGIASRQNAQVRVENNYFDTVPIPIRADTSLSDVAGFVSLVSSNIFVNCGPNSITTPPGTFVPPYSYPVDPAANVPSIVQQGAGVGKVTF
jgi:pectate lyase